MKLIVMAIPLILFVSSSARIFDACIERVTATSKNVLRMRGTI